MRVSEQAMLKGDRELTPIDSFRLACLAKGIRVTPLDNCNSYKLHKGQHRVTVTYVEGRGIVTNDDHGFLNLLSAADLRF